ncbi:MAG: hypothetical protein M3Y87_16020 [Myxococcota bacterium]|nr:hypothetical protein [Myxococcota bacterium]
MTDRSRQPTLDELRRTWEAESAPQVAREDAFWTYWTRTARSSGGLGPAQWAELLSCDLGNLGNVIGDLTQRDLVPPELVVRVRSRLAALDSGDARWAEVQLDAREAVRALVSGAAPDEHLLDRVVRKGTIWAALAVTSVLEKDALVRLRALSDGRRVFTSGQREQLRQAIRAATRL